MSRYQQYDPALTRAKGGQPRRITIDGPAEVRMAWIAGVLKERLGVNPTLSLIVRLAVRHFVDYLGEHLDALGEDQHKESARLMLAIREAVMVPRGHKAWRDRGIPLERALTVPLRPLHAVVKEWEAEQPGHVDKEEWDLWYATQFPPGVGPKKRWKATAAPPLPLPREALSCEPPCEPLS
jgi:hypothetical protein